MERAAFKQVLDELNAGFGDALHIKFEPLGLASTGQRSQEVINREIVCSRNREISVVYRAISVDSRLRLQDEQFHRAFARWQKKRQGKPQAPEIFVFIKHIDSASMADPGPQLQKVLDFRKSLEESRQVLSHGFANEAEFKAEVDRHLRAVAKGGVAAGQRSARQGALAARGHRRGAEGEGREGTSLGPPSVG